MRLSHDIESEERTGSLASGVPGQGVVIGELVALSADGRVPLVIFRDRPGSAAVAARAMLELFPRHIGRQVVLLFEEGDPARPIVAGMLAACDVNKSSLLDTAEVEADGSRLIVSAIQELTLRCGEASITLTREGKVLIRGTFVSTRSSGVNRIVGGAVQIN